MTELSERRVIALVAAVQLVNVLDFVMVMPMGPDFAKGLGIDLSYLGFIGGSYTVAACLAGLVSSLFLDRFDRRTALAFAMSGLVLGTAAGGFARGFRSLLAARILAGAFGGPATSLSYSIVADVIPPERRGRAMGLVMSTFAIAQAMGIPVGLELARWGGWRMPFYGVAGLGLLTAASAVWALPPLRLHLEAKSADSPPARGRGTGALLTDPTALLAFAGVATALFSSFLFIPNYSGYVQQNLGYPREDLSKLYLVAGACNFVALTGSGRLVDRVGALAVTSLGTIVLVVCLAYGFIRQPPVFSPLAILITFMLGNSTRQVALTTLTSKVPAPEERAGFMSLQSAALHLASSAGSFLGAHMLVETPEKRLAGVEQLGWLGVAVSAFLPFFVFGIERRLRGRSPVVAESPLVDLA